MADRKITDLTALAAGSQATGDLLTIVDVSEAAATDKNKKITVESLFKGIPGNVGVGTASPSTAFHISKPLPIVTLQDSDNTGNAALQRIDAKHSGGSTQWFIGKNSTSNADLYIQNVSNAALRFATNNTEQMRIDSSGRLLLGTTTARANLTVALGNGSIPAAGASTGAAVFSNGTDDAVYGVVVGANTSGTGYIQAQRTDGTATTYNLAVQPNGGNVGIGTTSPAAKLDITHGNELGLLTSGPYNFQAKFESTDSEAAIVIEDNNSTNDGNRIGVIGDNMAFTTANSERMRILSSGGITFNGDTAAANALNDYEEGTFDAFATVAGSFTGESTRHSRYTRIGNMVYCDLRVVWTGTTGSTGLVFDLPFAQAGTTGTNSASGHTGIVFYQGTSVDASAITAHIAEGSNKVSFYHTDGGNFVAVALNNVNGSYDWIVSFSYLAA